MPRPDGRAPHELRPTTITRGFLKSAPGAVHIAMGDTRVLCTATVEDRVPGHRAGKGGWLTAEYAMLPGSTNTRKARRIGGRETEIQRLIGRSLRAVCDLDALGERTIYLDCDVLQADGGTRTAAITGAAVALDDCLRVLERDGAITAWPLRELVAAVSVGVIAGEPRVDLCYEEDAAADVDMNIVMTAGGEFIEVQGAAEGSPFARATLDAMLSLAQASIEELLATQRAALA